MATIHFSSSDTFLEHDQTGRACASADVEIVDYLEATYEWLRHGDQAHSLEFATYLNGGWELNDGRRFSDWALKV